ncbi:hypothetical protein GQ53DRAFT_835074 [Thozetella sp. PMI_491]|nr:hypothetical protein GQ53DRAFT_835074 [Thozetella sp. PMI_491]
MDPLGCARCTAKSVICHYQTGPVQQISQPSETFVVNGVAEQLHDSELPIFRDGETNCSAFTEPGEPLPDRICPPTLADEADFSNDLWRMIDATTSINGPPLCETHMGNVGGSDESPERSHGTEQSALCTPSVSIPTSLTYQDPSDLLERRKAAKAALDISSNIVLHILRSFPSMMLGNNSMPPFVHPKFKGSTTRGIRCLCPLDTAKQLSRLLAHGMSKSYVWGLIRTEQERMLTQYLTFGKWELLGSLQSLVLYLLLRIVEGRRDYTRFGTQLLISINVLCSYLVTLCGNFVRVEEFEGRILPWQDWVFQDTFGTVRVINRLFHADLAFPCSEIAQYAFAPLPSRMSLWLAENEVEWAVDFVESPQRNVMQGILRNGALVTIKGLDWKPDRNMDWDLWYAGADSFGLLVRLAADMALPPGATAGPMLPPS